jgi:hypothetical protein
MSDELEHSRKGPSGAAAWRRCPGKLNAEAKYPDRVGREAAEGTVFHEYAALALIHGLEPHDFPLGTVHHVDGYDVAYDEDMVRFMYAGLDWVRDNYHPEDGDLIFIEKRVNISPWCGEGEFGTSDVCIVKVKARKIIVFDWKYGKGVPVSPEKNDQQYLYTLGCWKTYNLQRVFDSPEDIEVEFYIEQPRAPGGGGSWTTNMKAVLEEGERIKKDAAATDNPNAPRIAGEKQCTFCRASGNCKEQADWLLHTYGQKYEDIEEYVEQGLPPAFDDPAELDPIVRVYMLLHWKAFKRYVDRVKQIVLEDIRQKRPVPLIKAVSGREGDRKFRPSDSEEAEEKLIELIGLDKAMPRQLISPTAAEKEVGKKVFKAEFASYIERAPGKPLLVPVTDRRPALEAMADKYDDMDDEDEDDE